jgi:hypothetical protein
MCGTLTALKQAVSAFAARFDAALVPPAQLAEVLADAGTIEKIFANIAATSAAQIALRGAGSCARSGLGRGTRLWDASLRRHGFRHVLLATTHRSTGPGAQFPTSPSGISSPSHNGFLPKTTRRASLLRTARQRRRVKSMPSGLSLDPAPDRSARHRPYRVSAHLQQRL